MQVIPFDEEPIVPSAPQFIADPWRFDLSLKEKSAVSYKPEETKYEEKKYERYPDARYRPRQYRPYNQEGYYPKEQYEREPYRPYVHGRAYDRYGNPKRFDGYKGDPRS